MIEGALSVINCRLQEEEREHARLIQVIRQYSRLPDDDPLWALLRMSRNKVLLLTDLIADIEALA